MAKTIKDLGIDKLSPEDRMALAFEIWESLDDQRPTYRLSNQQRAELTRRNAELDAHPELAMTWKQIREASKPRATAPVEHSGHRAR